MNMDFYDVYFTNNIDVRNRRIFICGEIEDDLVAKFTKALYILEANDESKPIEIIINTCGGCLYGAFAIYDLIRACKCHITTIGIGHVMSGGVVIISAGDERQSFPHTQFMFHEVSYEVPYQKHSVTKAEVAAAEKEDEVFLKCLADCTSRTVSEWGKITHGRPDKYFDAEQALEWGIIDKIIGVV